MASKTTIKTVAVVVDGSARFAHRCRRIVERHGGVCLEADVASAAKLAAEHRARVVITSNEVLASEPAFIDTLNAALASAGAPAPCVIAIDTGRLDPSELDTLLDAALPAANSA